MSDPYLPAEEDRETTRRSLEVIRNCGFEVQITTKSDLIVRDLDLLKDISMRYCSVVFTLTTTDEVLANRVEAAAPSPSTRITAIQALVDEGIHVGIAMTPILPFIEDDMDNLSSILTNARNAGASFVYAQPK
jgi:DNA repair photolyase